MAEQSSLDLCKPSLDWSSADLMPLDSICIGVRTIIGVGTRTRFSFFSLIYSPRAGGRRRYSLYIHRFLRMLLTCVVLMFKADANSSSTVIRGAHTNFSGLTHRWSAKVSVVPAIVTRSFLGVTPLMSVRVH